MAVQHPFCKIHASHFCPCVKPHLYRGEPEKVAAWDASVEEAVDDRAQAELAVTKKR